MKKVLVTGATGFLGTRLIEKISNIKGLEIVATGRTIKTEKISKKSNLEYILGDLKDTQFIDSITNGLDAIIHTAALSAQMGNPKDFYHSNIEVTKNLLKAAKSKKVKNFRFKHQLDLKEGDILPKPINIYSSSKREAEKLVQSSGIPYVILRPRALIGRGDKVIIPRILRAHREGRLMRMGDETNRVDITPVSNVVDAIILALNAEKKAVNQIYNISNGKPELLWPILDNLFLELKLAPPSKKISLRLVLVLAKLMELHAKFLNGYKEPALTIYGVGTLTMSFGMDISKAKKLLGYEPKQSVQEALDEFVEWYKSEEL